MISLKENLSKALTNFEGQGLSVELRDGKVYVSMEKQTSIRFRKLDCGERRSKSRKGTW